MKPLKASFGLVIIFLAANSSNVYAEATTGFILANPCAGCHGTNGKSVGRMPDLTKLKVKEIEVAMMKYKSGKRRATIMGRIARGYSNKQIKILANYFGAK